MVKVQCSCKHRAEVCESKKLCPIECLLLFFCVLLHWRTYGKTNSETIRAILFMFFYQFVYHYQTGFSRKLCVNVFILDLVYVNVFILDLVYVNVFILDLVCVNVFILDLVYVNVFILDLV